jgi:hypothetical protein
MRDQFYSDSVVNDFLYDAYKSKAILPSPEGGTIDAVKMGEVLLRHGNSLRKAGMTEIADALGGTGYTAQRRALRGSVPSWMPGEAINVTRPAKYPGAAYPAAGAIDIGAVQAASGLMNQIRPMDEGGR